MKLRTLTLALALAISAPAFAQDTSSAITGKITDTEGAAVSGATVKILHVPSGSTKTVVTDENGRYNSRGLRIGGPYLISIEKDGFDSTTKENVALKLGETGTVNAQIGTEATLAAVTVTASAISDTFDPAKMGASTIVGREQIEAFPTISRSINDYVRLDPRVTQIDKSNGAISVAGQNNRYNSVTIDGVPTNDEFGLNQGGLPSLNQPISLDTIEELSIGIASFDVTANDATGANINAVTKSGTNEFKGNVSAYYRKANWVGDDEQGREFNGFDDELTYGFTLGGPILQDRLFFFIAAEKFDSSAPAPTLNQAIRGGQTVDIISQSDIDRIRAAATRYGFAVGSGSIAGIDNTDRKYIAKIDWQINDDHRASVRWNKTKGETLEVRDNSATSLSFSDHWFNRIQDNESIVLNTYSDWTENFNTEFSISNSEYKALVPLVSNTPEVTVFDADRDRFLFGGERFRHANRLLVDTTTGFFAGNLFVGDHTVKFGADFKRTDTFNLFLESAFGRYEFNSIADLEAGRVATYTLRFPGALGPRSDVNAAAADWELDSIGLFAQDTWIVNSNLTVNYGFRYDLPQIDEQPQFNALLASASLPPAVGSLRPLGGLGLNNTGTPDGNGVLQPRAGFNYTFDSERRMQLRGGLGLFAGSPPGVWLSNNFSETGTLISEFVVRNPTNPLLITADPNQVPIPTAGGVAPRATVNLLDDDFEMPTVWKASLAFESELGFYDLIGSVEALFTETENGIFYENLNLGSNNNNALGRLPDGRIHYYQNLSPTNFANPGAPATAAGRRATENANFFDVLLLRNTNKGKTRNYTIGLEKPMLDNWYAKLSYTLGESSEPNPGAEARAITNWSQRPVFNTNEEVSATSNFEISDRLTLALSYKHAFFTDLNTTFSLFGEGRTGRRFGYVFRNDANGDNANALNDLFYIPLDRNDVGFRDVVVNGTNVSAQQQADLFWSYVESNDYLNSRRGQAAARNGQSAPWVTQFDFRLTQELPALFDTKSEVYFDILNIGNLINDRYGYIDDTGFGGTVAVADFIGTEQKPGAAGQRYVYRFTGAPSEFVRQDTRGQSRWGAQLGIRVSF